MGVLTLTPALTLTLNPTLTLVLTLTLTPTLTATLTDPSTGPTPTAHNTPQVEHARAHCRMVLDAATAWRRTHPDLAAVLAPLPVRHVPEPPAPPRLMGCVWVPSYPYARQAAQFTLRTFLTLPEVTEASVHIHAECARVRSRALCMMALPLALVRVRPNPTLTLTPTRVSVRESPHGSTLSCTLT